MNYLIAVLPDRIKAEEAYTALEKAGIPTQQVTIFGRGYRNAEGLGFLATNRQAKKNALRMAYWLVPFGFFGGYTFDAITSLDTFAWAGEPGNHIIGGLLGALGGAMGSLFVGGGSGLLGGNEDVLAYSNLLSAGKYLIVVESDEQIPERATAILGPLEPENLQAYQN